MYIFIPILLYDENKKKLSYRKKIILLLYIYFLVTTGTVEQSGEADWSKHWYSNTIVKRTTQKEPNITKFCWKICEACNSFTIQKGFSKQNISMQKNFSMQTLNANVSQFKQFSMQKQLLNAKNTQCKNFTMQKVLIAEARSRLAC